MKKRYVKPYFCLRFSVLTDNVIIMSGDGYADDPWSEGFGGWL